MSTRNRAILLIVMQCLLVSSIAAKYLYERATRPRVWVQTAQYDPDLPMRGRYLALSPLVNICGIKLQPPSDGKSRNWYRRGQVEVVARDGKLVAEDASGRLPRRGFPGIMFPDTIPCERAPVLFPIYYFIPEHAKSPFPLKPGQELWVEVTVPPSGPPRAIQVALSNNGKWQVLKLE